MDSLPKSGSRSPDAIREVGIYQLPDRSRTSQSPRFTSGTELRDQSLQLDTQACQFGTGGGGLLAGTGALLADIAHPGHAFADIFRHRALLFGGRGDLLVHLDRK